MKSVLMSIVPILLWGSWHEHKGLEATYEKAQATCKEMGKAWRVPDIRELFTRKGEAAAFSPNQNYRSATPLNEEESYVVGFKFGTVATGSNKNRSYVRCVSER